MRSPCKLRSEDEASRESDGERSGRSQGLQTYLHRPREGEHPRLVIHCGFLLSHELQVALHLLPRDISGLNGPFDCHPDLRVLGSTGFEA